MAAVRLARGEDAGPMLAIYAPLVRETAISFELTPPSEEEFRQRIRTTLETTPWLVCESAGDVLGYAYAGKFRPRPAYQWTAEVTIYVRQDCRGKGIARALYTSLFACLRLQGYRNAIAVITVPNPPSVRLHEAFGFGPVGVFKSAGYKIGLWHDIGWWQLALQDHPPAPEPPRPIGGVVGSAAWREALVAGATFLKV